MKNSLLSDQLLKQHKSDLPITLQLSINQAQAVFNALEIYLHLGIGDVTFLRNALADGTIPKRRDSESGRDCLNADECGDAEEFLKKLALIIGHGTSSYGIGNKFVPERIKSGWGVKQVVEQALSVARSNEMAHEIKCGTMFELAPSPIARVSQ
ncbi:hypothetical protein OTK49_01575 [Vibrio coralliirubri]|nr:hypothetical protein [Vibrio coralliirubri]